MYQTGTIGTYTHRIHQLPETVADVDDFIAEANADYLSIVSANISGKWERELRKRKYLLTHDPTYLSIQMLGSNAGGINYILDENGNALLDEQFGSGILPEVQDSPYLPFALTATIFNDNGNNTAEYEVTWSYQDTVTFPKAGAFFDLQLLDIGASPLWSTGLLVTDSNTVGIDYQYYNESVIVAPGDVVNQRIRYRYNNTTGDWVVA